MTPSWKKLSTRLSQVDDAKDDEDLDRKRATIVPISKPIFIQLDTSYQKSLLDPQHKVEGYERPSNRHEQAVTPQQSECENLSDEKHYLEAENGSISNSDHQLKKPQGLSTHDEDLITSLNRQLQEEKAKVESLTNSCNDKALELSSMENVMRVLKEHNQQLQIKVTGLETDPVPGNRKSEAVLQSFFDRHTKLKASYEDLLSKLTEEKDLRKSLEESTQILESEAEHSRVLISELESEVYSLELSRPTTLRSLLTLRVVEQRTTLPSDDDEIETDHRLTKSLEWIPVGLQQIELDKICTSVEIQDFATKLRKGQAYNLFYKRVSLHTCAVCSKAKFNIKLSAHPRHKSLEWLNEYLGKSRYFTCCQNKVCKECFKKHLLDTLASGWWLVLDTLQWFPCPRKACKKALGISYVKAEAFRRALQSLDLKPSDNALQEAAELTQHLVRTNVMYSPFDPRFDIALVDETGCIPEFTPGTIYNAILDDSLTPIPLFMKFFRREKKPRECMACSKAMFEIDYGSVDEWLNICEGFRGSWMWNILVFPTSAIQSCDHEFEICRACTSEHIRNTLVSGGPSACANLTCPQCSRKLAHHEVHELADAETVAKYEKFLLQTFLSNEENFRWCLNPVCESGQLCNPPPPKGKIKTHTKKCPNENCEANIQKGEYCFHMTCSQCRYEFCWECLAPWREIRLLGQEAHEIGCFFRTSDLSAMALRGENLEVALGDGFNDAMALRAAMDQAARSEGEVKMGLTLAQKLGIWIGIGLLIFLVFFLYCWCFAFSRREQRASAPPDAAMTLPIAEREQYREQWHRVSRDGRWEEMEFARHSTSEGIREMSPAQVQAALEQSEAVRRQYREQWHLVSQQGIESARPGSSDGSHGIPPRQMGYPQIPFELPSPHQSEAVREHYLEQWSMNRGNDNQPPQLFQPIRHSQNQSIDSDRRAHDQVVAESGISRLPLKARNTDSTLGNDSLQNAESGIWQDAAMTAEAQLDPYKYSPLKERSSIRLLRIEPGHRVEPLKCNFLDTNIGSPQTYEAISYVWGNYELSETIECNSKSLRITKSLESALRRIRLTDQSRLVWADAICIDQENLDERGQQVKLMQQVYSHAVRVLVWLGNHNNEKIKTAIDLADRISRLASKEVGNVDIPSPKNVQWLALADLFDCNWFWRLWVIQEITSAPTGLLLWGDHEIPWQKVGLTAAWLRATGYEVFHHSPMTGVFNAYLMYGITEEGRQGIKTTSFLGLMSLTRQFHSTDLRDRVYAILGLPHTDRDAEDGSKSIEPDYTKTVEQVYFELAQKMLVVTDSLKLLSAVQHGPALEEEGDLPSWVPRWDRLYTYQLTPGTQRYSASTGLSPAKISTPIPSNPLSTSKLRVQGFRFQTIAMISDVFGRGATVSSLWHSILTTWKTLIEPLTSDPTAHHTGGKTVRAFQEALTAGKDWYGEVAEQQEAFRDFSDFCCRVNENSHLASEILPPPINDGSLVACVSEEWRGGSYQRFLEAAKNGCGGRRLFVTQKRWIGLGPAAQGEGCYRLVGEAYIPGLMNVKMAYRYTPLNEDRGEIRLITLLAGSFSDKVEVRIHHAAFPDDKTTVPKFEALSYTWGVIGNPVEITVGTHSPGAILARLPVSKNLATALPYLRHEEKDRTLWIDAICINQEDHNERSSQVQKMGRIYSQAERVLAWLGPAESHSHHAIETLDSLAARISVDWSTQEIQPISDKLNEWADLMISLPFNDADWDAIQSLCSRSWFERLWIRQEIWLANKADLICGNSVLSWESFRKAIWCIYNKPRTIEVESFWDRMELLETLVNNNDCGSLGYEIFRSRHSKCLDPRDRIYAMLGLITEDKSQWTVTPDYSTNVSHVYKNVAIGYIDAFSDLNFLRFCDIGARECGRDLPSWAPDWQCLLSSAPLLPTYSAHGLASAKIRFEGDTLHALGLLIGSVKIAAEIKMDSNMFYGDAVLDIQHFAAPHMPDTTEPQYQVQLDALCRTLVVDEFEEPPSPSLTEMAARTALSKMLRCTRTDCNSLLIDDRDIQLYLNKAQWCCTRRSLISTSNGLLGLAPKATQVGDIVCVLLGCTNPLVMRRTTENSNRYEVVGECYVDSIMRGEAFLGPLPEGITQVTKFDEQLGYDRQAFLNHHTSKIQFVDPRYDSYLGGGLGERLKSEDCDGDEDQNRDNIIEIMRVRGVDLDCNEMELTPAQAKAKSHIEGISRKKVQYADDGKEGVVADLQGALKILSEQLYNKSTHFLLELIQNADDNSYEAGTRPTLNLTYSNGQLRVDCNEDGFTRENVDAICAIGSSSKVRIDQKGRYIGHKGIGFKSVFKAADVVHIYSRNYSFKFDKTNEPLGMINPIWEDPPDGIPPQHTSFCLQLSNDSIHFKRDELIKDLHSTDSRVLIFLNKLEELHLSILSDTEPRWEITLTKKVGHKNGIPIITLKENHKVLEYVVSKDQVELPIEGGTGHRISEIILAFPLVDSDNQTETTEAEPQKVYAFLPVRDYGFKFLLQADFALTANREDLDESHPRNKLLYKAIQNAFKKAVEDLSSSILRYSWLRYLPRARPAGLLRWLGLEIECSLFHLPILESCAGLMTPPTSLKFIPLKFRDNMGIPFTLCSDTEAKYLSPKYHAQFAEALTAIGVKELSFDAFLEDLDWFANNNYQQFQQKVPEWHSQLAQALLPELGTTSSLTALKRVKIIPLRGGEWVSAENNTIFFSENNSQVSIPDGIQVLVVDPAVARDSHRQNLFTGLGVKQHDTSNICRLIMDLHQDSTKASSLSPNQLISHAEFLYRSDYKPPQDQELWFATDLDGKCQGSQLYVDMGTESTSAAANFFHVDEGFPFLHGDYLLLFPDQNEKWLLWLSENFGLSSVPRLVTFPRKDDFALSGDFQHLFRTQLSSKVLSLLRDNWKYYSKWIEESTHDAPGSLLEQSRTKVRTQLASTLVLCLNGRTHRLGKTSLPALDPDFSLGSHFAVLDISDPDDRRWQVLQCLGVAVKKDLYFYLLCFENMQSSEVPIEDAIHLYEEVQSRYTENEQRLIKFADENPIVYIPPINDDEYPRWVKHQDCVWREGTANISPSGYALENHYPSCKKLFCSILGVYDNDIELLLAEAGKINTSSNLTDIAHLLIRISNALMGRSVETLRLIQKLTSANIFPVRTSAEEGKFDRLTSKDDPRDWFIADRPHLLGSFREKITLLAFTIEEVSQLDNLFGVFRLDHRRLSRVASGRPRPRGELSRNEDYAEDFRQKAAFVARLVPRYAKQRLPSLYSRLRSIAVYEATSVRQNWSVVSDGHRIYGRERSVRVALDEKENWLYLFMTKEDINSPLAPVELIDRISLFCDIKDSKSITILCSVLSRMSTKALQDLFQRQGIPDAKELYELQEKKGWGIDYSTELLCDEQQLTNQTHPQTKKSSKKPSLLSHKKNATEETSKAEYPIGEKISAEQEKTAEEKPAQQHANLSDDAAERQRIPWKKIVGAKGDGITVGADSKMDAYEDLNFSSPSSLLKSSNQRQDVNNKSNQVAQNHEPSLPKNQKSGGLTYPTQPTAAKEATVSSQNASSDQKIGIPTRYHFKSEFSKSSIPRMEASDNILVRGELITSNFFQRRIGRSYAPEAHWTSPLRSQVGYPKFTGDSNTHASFTFTNCRKRVTDILIHHGHRTAENWRAWPPVYHVDVATTTGQPESFFPLSVGQLDRRWVELSVRYYQARKYALQSASAPEHVLILVKISKVQSDIDFRFFVDPWQLYLADSLRLQPGTFFKATIGEPPRKTSPPRQVKGQMKGRSRLRNILGLCVPHEDEGENEDVDIGNSATELDLSRSVRVGDTKRLGPYPYKTLRGANQIRLLNLLPGENGTMLKGIIRHTSLEKPEPYQALSYVWGDPTGDHVLQTPEGLIRIYSSLHSALQSLRDTQKERMIWVDAICINQDDKKDKDKQIPLMAKIYNSATFVIAYLGVGADDSNLALQTLQQIKTKAAEPKTWPSDLQPIPGSWEDNFIPPANDSTWTALGALFARRWFNRVWIIQEVVVAAKVIVVCGDWMDDWNELYKAVLIARREIITGGEEYRALRSTFEAFMTLAGARERDDESFDWALYNLLEKFRYADATIESDRMFALLNLAADRNTQPQLFEQNYDLPFETVVLRYASAFVRQGRTLPMIYSAGLSLARNNDLFPSWTPDWTAKTRGTLFDALERGVPHAPETNIPLRSTVQEDAEDELLLSGVLLVDEIIYVSEATNTPEMLPQYLNEVENVISSRISAYPTGERRSNLKWKVPIANAEVPMVAAFNPLKLQDSYHALMGLLEEGISPYNQEDMHEGMPNINGEMGNSQPQNAWVVSQDYLSALQGTFLGWRFVVTDRGYVGIAPNFTRVGDVVSLLGGSKVAFLIRESRTRQAYHLCNSTLLPSILMASNGQATSPRASAASPESELSINSARSSFINSGTHDFDSIARPPISRSSNEEASSSASEPFRSSRVVNAIESTTTSMIPESKLSVSEHVVWKVHWTAPTKMTANELDFNASTFVDVRLRGTKAWNPANRNYTSYFFGGYDFTWLSAQEFRYTCTTWEILYHISWDTSGNIQTIREPFNWKHLQPYATMTAIYNSKSWAYSIIMGPISSFIAGLVSYVDMVTMPADDGQGCIGTDDCYQLETISQVAPYETRLEETALSTSLHLDPKYRISTVGSSGNKSMRELIEELSRNITLSLFNNSRLCVLVGLRAYQINGVSCDASFSGIISTTENPTLDALTKGHSLGAQPLRKEIAKTKLMIGVLEGGDNLDDASRLGFGLLGKPDTAGTSEGFAGQFREEIPFAQLLDFNLIARVDIP
ncbi:hypothetical protein G7Y89_g4978 [Cudoniella acicularis]|uniref:RING-type domain-containing protein n=1 Tax=Cudoniella acicularis TaxID=354080 RepID=A0A8H4RQK3_9HELO|nr:hypothetical protein G7Y89_g4978 [Cudoniella acicularis]